MDMPIRSKPAGADALAFGSKELKDQFTFGPEWLNLNHGTSHWETHSNYGC